MKKNIIITSLILGSALALTGCNRPSEREASVNAKIAGDLVEISSVAEVTGKEANVYASAGADVKAFGVKVNKLEGGAQAIIDRVSNEGHKKAITDHMGSGAIALVVLKDQVKILKVVPDTVSSSLEVDLKSLKLMSAMKALAKASNPQAATQLSNEVAQLTYASPADFGEKFGMIEVAAVEIKKSGVMDNQRTDYGEKKSILDLQAKPLEFSTHLLLGKEVGEE